MIIPDVKSIEGLSEQFIIDIDRRGKYLIFIFSNETMISHLRMEGKYFYYPKAHQVDKHTHVVFYFKDGSELHYNDFRKFGRMQMSNFKYLDLPPLSELGKEPFELTVDDLYPYFKGSNRYLKEVLLDQHIILGLGNIYANETCFMMGLHPKTRVKNLSKVKIQKLIDASCDVLSRAIEQGGTTVHTFSALGIDGRFQVELKVHGHENEPCQVCGTKIKKIKVGGRGTYYCPKCQIKRK